MKKNLLPLAFIAILVALALVNLKQSPQPKPVVKKASVNAKYGRTLVYGRGADAISLDPANMSDTESIKVSMQVNEGLLRIKTGATEIEPCLATHWKTSTDGLTWTFYLRQGVKFHDETPFNADAVLFSFKRQMDKNHPYHEGDFSYWSMYTNIKEVEKIDDYIVQVKTDTPYAPLLANLAIFPAAIVSPTAMIEKGVKGFSKSPVGTGPFKFIKWIADDEITLEANKSYWGGRPYLDKIVYKTIRNNSIRTLHLAKGDIDAIDGIDPDSANKIKRNSSLRLLSQPGLNVGYMAMHCEKKPFNDKRVRQAINYAINKGSIVKLLYQGLATPAKNPIPPTMWSYNDAVEPYEYNIEKAKKLLAEAGYPNGFKTTLDVMENPRPYMPEPRKVAEAIQESLSHVGIDVNYTVRDWKTHWSIRAKGGLHDMTLIGWIGDNGDPDNFLYTFFGKASAVAPKALNMAFYKNDEVNDILIKAQQTTDQEERARLYKKSQEIIHDEAPWLPIAHVQDLGGINRRVKNFKLQPIPAGIFMREVWLEE